MSVWQTQSTLFTAGGGVRVGVGIFTVQRMRADDKNPHFNSPSSRKKSTLSLPNTHINLQKIIQLGIKIFNTQKLGLVKIYEKINKEKSEVGRNK